MSTHQRQQPLARTADFLAALRDSRLIAPQILDKLASLWSDEGDPHLHGLDLVESRLLTHLQARLILAGRGRQLRLGRYLLIERLGSDGLVRRMATLAESRQKGQQ